MKINKRLFVISALLISSLFSCGSDGDDSSVDGSTCKVDSDCANSSYCMFPEGSCGLDARPGACQQRAEICTLIFMPVCGCDGKTYSSSCNAASAGVSVKSQGECHTE